MVNEIYEQRKGNQPETKEPTKHEKLWREDVEKEKELEVQKTVNACAEYHEKLDKTGYFNSRAAKEAARLLPLFRDIKKERLPESLRNVVKHRIAYLELMSGLGKNTKLMGLLDKTEPTLLKQGMFNKNFNALLKEIQTLPEYKNLTPKDFAEAYKVVTTGLVSLKGLNRTQGNWESESAKYLKDRADDQKSAKNLEQGLQVVANNLLRLQVNPPLKPRKSA
jgi:hypothetical protein